MKEKNLPGDNSLKSLEELTEEINKTIKELEKEKNLEDSLDNYQKLIKLNNIIEKKFQITSRQISNEAKEKIKKIVNKNVKKIK